MEAKLSKIIQGEDKWTELPKSECIQFGKHLYILQDEIKIQQALSALWDGKVVPTERIEHLHIYCQRLVFERDGCVDIGFNLNDDAKAFNIKTIDVFAAEVPPFAEILVTGWSWPQKSINICLYYDVDSGPGSFWLNKKNNPAYHVYRDPESLFECNGDLCKDARHFDISSPQVTGIRIVAVSPDEGYLCLIKDVQAISAVFWEELRPLLPADFTIMGADRRRLQMLPRLLERLFDSAGGELMAPKPNVPRIMAKLRFINRCAGDAPNWAGLLAESNVLLGRLQLPRSFKLQKKDSGNQDENEKSLAKDNDLFYNPDTSHDYDLFYVPNQQPRALKNEMEADIQRYINLNKRLESDEHMMTLKKLITTSTSNILVSVKETIGREITISMLEAAQDEAISKTADVQMKKLYLSGYERSMTDASTRFKEGMEVFQEEQDKKFWLEIGKNVAILGLSVGAAIYSGGAAAPLTVGALNQVLNGLDSIQEASRMKMAAKAMFTTAMKVLPKIWEAINDHEKFSDESRSRAKSSTVLKEAAEKITHKTFSSDGQQRIDFAGLLADWRELDISTDTAFAIMKEDLEGEHISGLDDYHLALKKLVIRGETLISVMREAHEARKQFLLLTAEKKAKDKSLAMINDIHQSNETDQKAEKMKFLALKHASMRELTIRRCTIFNMLHNGVLALMYRANAVKVSQQRAFDGLSLSPLSNASQLEDYWVAFSKATARDEQPQSSELELFADQLCPRGWKELLATDLEVPFRVPHTHPSLSDQHRMRIRSLYATFVGLKRRDGSMAIEDQIEYKVSLGPLMVDRASPREGARSSDATLVQYYREPRVLKKTGKKNDLLDDEHQFSRVSLCCRGSIAFKRSAVEDSRTGWDLSTITDIQITFGYETLVFSD